MKKYLNNCVKKYLNNYIKRVKIQLTVFIVAITVCISDLIWGLGTKGYWCGSGSFVFGCSVQSQTKLQTTVQQP